MTEQFVLRIDGIEGDCVLEGHEGSIEVISWSWGVVRPGGQGPSTGGGSASRPDFDELHVAMLISKASPVLVESCVTGRHHRTAVLTGLRSGGGQLVEFLEYEFGDVTVTSVEHGDGDDGPPAEAVSIDYRSFDIRHVSQQPDGSGGQTTAFSHDLTRSKSA